MSYVIEDNYSVLNNYSYHGKSSIISALDWWSTPCRRVLGGRNVSLKSLTYEHPMSTCCRVTTFFFSLVFFPIGIISVICFTAKLFTFPCIWEKKKIITLTRQAWQQRERQELEAERQLKEGERQLQEAVDKFNRYYHQGKLENVIQVLDQHPSLQNREDISRKLFSLANQRINQGVAWHAVQPALEKLTAQDAIALINYAVKVKIEEACNEQRFVVSAQDIKELAIKSLPSSLENLEKCYKCLFADALHIKDASNVLGNIIKIDIGLHLIENLIFCQREIHNNFICAASPLSLKLSLFEDELLSSFTFLFSDEDWFHAQVKNVRTIEKFQDYHFDHLTALAKNTEIAQLDKLKGIHNQIKTFLKNLDRLEASFTNEDYDTQKVLDCLQAYSESLEDFIELCTTNSSKETLIQQYEAIIPNIEKLANESKGLRDEIQKRQSPSFTNTQIAISDLLFSLKIAALPKTCEQTNKILMEVLQG